MVKNQNANTDVSQWSWKQWSVFAYVAASLAIIGYLTLELVTSWNNIEVLSQQIKQYEKPNYINTNRFTGNVAKA